MKQCIETTLDLHTDAFKVQEYLQKQPGVLKVHIVTCNAVRIYFDDRKVQDKLILKLIVRCSKKKNSRNRSSNVKSIKAVPFLDSENNPSQDSLTPKN